MTPSKLLRALDDNTECTDIWVETKLVAYQCYQVIIRSSANENYVLSEVYPTNHDAREAADLVRLGYKLGKKMQARKISKSVRSTAGFPAAR